ncbi:hypothetical protein FRC01_010145, partial [Tulasnella sp. 417]
MTSSSPAGRLSSVMVIRMVRIDLTVRLNMDRYRDLFLGVIGTVNTLIKIIYKDTPGLNLKRYSTTFSSLAFAGTVAGMLIFGL